MRIRRIFADRVELPLHETTYKWSGGKSVTVFDSTIVGAHTSLSGERHLVNPVAPGWASPEGKWDDARVAGKDKKHYGDAPLRHRNQARTFHPLAEE